MLHAIKLHGLIRRQPSCVLPKVAFGLAEVDYVKWGFPVYCGDCDIMQRFVVSTSLVSSPDKAMLEMLFPRVLHQKEYQLSWRPPKQFNRRVISNLVLCVAIVALQPSMAVVSVYTKLISIHSNHRDSTSSVLSLSEVPTARSYFLAQSTNGSIVLKSQYSSN